jgi:hypothetical protein
LRIRQRWGLFGKTAAVYLVTPYAGLYAAPEAGDPGFHACSNALAPRVLRTGARIAGRLGAKWYAVYVETPRERPGRINPHDSDALQENIKLAESLGATVVRVKAERPAGGLVAFA